MVLKNMTQRICLKTNESKTLIMKESLTDPQLLPHRSVSAKAVLFNGKIM